MFFKKLPFLRCITLLIPGLLGLDAVAQITNQSPYSRFGIGDLLPRSTTENRAMGGVGTAMSFSDRINLLNPASLSKLNVISFGAALQSDLVSISDGTDNQLLNNTNLGYLNMAFPILKNKMGASFGLIQYSNTGYNIRNNVINPTVGSLFYAYEGEGGINQVHFGTGLEIMKGFSVGANAYYNFGVIEKFRKVEFPRDSLYYFNTRVTSSTTISDFSWDAGLQYSKELNEKAKLGLGLRVQGASSLSAKRNELAERYQLSISDAVVVLDTINFDPEQKGELSLPLSWSFGLSYEYDNKWLLGLDLGMQDWSKFKSFNESDSLANSFYVAAGAQFVPDRTSVTNYWKRVNYRTGLRYSQSYLDINNNQLSELGITFGIGLPVRRTPLGRSFSTANLAIELGQRGTTESNLLKETFAKFTIGFTLNDDSWFIKRKYD